MGADQQKAKQPATWKEKCHKKRLAKMISRHGHRLHNEQSTYERFARRAQDREAKALAKLSEAKAISVLGISGREAWTRFGI